ncbi:MAG TPA: ATPase [Planctomycetaceae bacterium]|nr:ATPase [Planctomycetaceae bacterium]
MSTSEALDTLRSRVLSRYTMLFLKTWEEDRWESLLSELALEIERGLVTWSSTSGWQPPLSGEAAPDDPVAFLDDITGYPSNHVFLLKDFHPFLEDPAIVRRLRDLAPVLTEQGKTVLFVGPVCQIPVELQTEAVAMELPLPGLEEMREQLVAVLSDRRELGEAVLEFDPASEERLLKAVLGLTAREGRKALARALLGRDEVDDDMFRQLVSEKKHLVQGSDLLEFHDLEEGLADVGGLEGLKEWIGQRANAFSTRAQEQGVPTPKGVFLLGVQGCGKSLISRAIAQLLSFPLVRLDVSNLLASDQGQSEQNMRYVLNLVETIAPAVLWIDEIDKGFSGSGEMAQETTMTRLLGRFLTWMQEHRSQVFVVATANSIHRLPPEMLRRGRFDELFFVNLPNFHERKPIFDIHLAKRGWKPAKYDVETLARQTEGYSGAEIEQIVVTALVECYNQGRVLTQKDLENSREETVPLSVTMEEQIFELREWARDRCRPATPDSRVVQMLEEEQGHTEELQFEADTETDDGDAEWLALAEHGQVPAALVEYVRRRGEVAFAELTSDFEPFVETEGDQGLALRSDPNVVLWYGIPQELAATLAKLVSSRKLFLYPAPVEQLRAENAPGDLPMIDRLPEERVDRPMWLPVMIGDVAPEGGVGRFGRVARMALSR